MANIVYVGHVLKVELPVWLAVLLEVAVVDGERVDILVVGALREEVAETVDVRLSIEDRVFVKDDVDVLECAIVKVGDLLMNGVLLEKADRVGVIVVLDV